MYGKPHHSFGAMRIFQQITTGYWARRLRALVLLPMLALGFISCATTDLVTGQPVNNIFSIQDDIDMGRQAYNDFVKAAREEGIPVNRDPQRVAQLKTIVSRLAEASRVTSFPYRVTLFQTNIVNALALPGGEIIVFDGLWDKRHGLVWDEDELAAVLAHEMAHVNCRHSTEEITSHMPAQLLLSGLMLYADYDKNEDLALAVSAAFLLYEGLWVPKYSRTQEAEADRVGLTYMARAGYNPEAAVRLWERASEMEGDDWGMLSIFSTHPSNRTRYRELEQLLPQAMAEYRAATGGQPRTPPRMLNAEKEPAPKTETSNVPPAENNKWGGLFERN